ncbi:MAG: hypothetical protein KIT09_07075 [Bryobacteraceae bacterium]|nr:hypothetical protein [Bryobacteraceae bacterium]
MVQILKYLLVAAALILVVGRAPARAQKFYPDDPIQVIPDLAPVEDPRERRIDALFDFFYQSVRAEPREPQPSLAVNTLGEVPDSSWFTNRHARRRLTRDELQRPPGPGHAPEAPLQVIGGKTEGITPGFQLRDAKGRIYFVKPDPWTNPEMASAADVVGARFFYALGYNTPENYVLRARLEDLAIGKDATVRGLSGKKRPMTPRDLAAILDRAARDKNGRIRMVASYRLAGKSLGPFRYEGTRSDDPNDVVPHERRRDLRGLHVFCAWLNHTDAKSGNSLDTLIEEGGRSFIRHHLIDFGSILGSDSDMAKNARFGHEFVLPTGGETLRRMFTFGLAPRDWELARFPDLPAVGRIEAETFDPDTWKSNYPNPAFLSRLPEDEYWAAKIVMAFTDSDIRALVETGEYSDPKVVEYLVATLRKRRDKIGRACFDKVLPLDDFHVADGELRFVDLAAKYGFRAARSFHAEWSLFDNRNERHAPINGATGFRLPESCGAAPNGSYCAVRISTDGDTGKSVTVYLRKEAGGAAVVGIERSA